MVCQGYACLRCGTRFCQKYRPCPVCTASSSSARLAGALRQVVRAWDAYKEAYILEPTVEIARERLRQHEDREDTVAANSGG